jgi:hypothetical protein
MNDGDGPSIMEQNRWNIASACGEGFAKAWIAVAIAGATGNGWSAATSVVGFGIGVLFGLPQPCTCPAQ